MREDLLESFREDEAQLDASTDERIRRRIAQLTKTDSDQDGAWPFSSEPVPLLGASSGAERRAPRPKQATTPKDPSRRLLAVAAGVLAVALLSGALAMQLTRSTQPSNQVGGETMESVAALAALQPDRPLGPGEYLHQRWEDSQSSGVGQSDDGVEVNRWTAVDGTGRETRQQLGQGAAGVVYPASDFTQDEAGTLTFAQLTYSQLRGLPDDPAGLMASISSIFGVPDDQPGLMGERLVEVLALEVTPPPVRAAAFEALETLGATSVGPRTDRKGRTGQGFLVPGEQGLTLVIVDPGTTAIWESVTGIAGDTSEPSISNATIWRTFLSQNVTTSTS